jgi:hypothetical protein
MINRSSIKYHLKKILPKSLFKLIVLLWRGVVLKLVEGIDTLRLRWLHILEDILRHQVVV